MSTPALLPAALASVIATGTPVAFPPNLPLLDAIPQVAAYTDFPPLPTLDFIPLGDTSVVPEAAYTDFPPLPTVDFVADPVAQATNIDSTSLEVLDGIPPDTTGSFLTSYITSLLDMGITGTLTGTYVVTETTPMIPADIMVPTKIYSQDQATQSVVVVPNPTGPLINNTNNYGWHTAGFGSYISGSAQSTEPAAASETTVGGSNSTIPDGPVQFTPGSGATRKSLQYFKIAGLGALAFILSWIL